MKSEFLAFAASILKVPSVSESTAFGSIPEWDSVMHLRLVLEIESRYAVKFSMEQVANFRTLGDFFAVVREKAFLDSMAACLERERVDKDTVLSEADGWCSLMAFSVLFALERKFGIAMSLADLASCRTIGDVAIRSGISR